MTRGPVVSGANGCMHACESKINIHSKARMTDHPPTNNRHAMSYSFLLPVPSDIIRGHVGCGGIAVNVDGTFVASMHSSGHCVYICSVTDPTADAVVIDIVES